MWLSEIPEGVASFIDAVRRRSAPCILISFASGAVVREASREYRGGNVSLWVEALVNRPRDIVRPIRATRTGGQITMTILMQDAGSNTAEHVEWALAMAGPKISDLAIRPSQLPPMPIPVAAYVLATNRFDLDGLVHAFADDALVNDQLFEYWGRDQIRHWAQRDIIGQQTVVYVTKVVQRYTDAVVTAHVDGSYDKRGLPNPLVLTFYFSLSAEKIVQLIILRNE
jgi:hypothetical protein